MLEKDQLLTLDRPQPRCVECSAELDPIGRHPTRMRMKDVDMERADFCPDCWEFAKAEAFDSYWVTRRILKERQMPKLSRREKGTVTRALFDSLWERREEEDVDIHLYFLGHLLLRWGALKWRENRTDDSGREVVVFENPATGDLMEIPAVEPDNESIRSVRNRIEAFLIDYAPEADVIVE